MTIMMSVLVSFLWSKYLDIFLKIDFFAITSLIMGGEFDTIPHLLE